MNNTNVLREFAQNILNEKKFSLGEAVAVENLFFVPVLRKEVPREERDFLTIDEALNESLLTITDKGDEIAHILIENQADLPVLIEEGEIFEGKDTQDRIAVGTVVIQPRTTVEVPVKCVHAPHPLATNARFSSGGKGSYVMLRNMRAMKHGKAKSRSSPASISQSAIWSNVASETGSEQVRDSSKYKEAMEQRAKRVEKRNIEFPENTIGLLSISEENKLMGMELHRNPRAFKRRKDSILVSLENEIKKGVKPTSKQQAAQKCREVFKQLSAIEEDQVQAQMEVDGKLINLSSGLQGEFTSNKFYSGKCPECGSPKPRIAVCPKCGVEEKVADEFMHMSL